MKLQLLEEYFSNKQRGVKLRYRNNVVYVFFYKNKNKWKRIIWDLPQPSLPLGWTLSTTLNSRMKLVFAFSEENFQNISHLTPWKIFKYALHAEMDLPAYSLFIVYQRLITALARWKIDSSKSYYLKKICILAYCFLRCWLYHGKSPRA
jgi:hypothetical protein